MGGNPIHNSSKQWNFPHEQVFPVDLCVSSCSYSEHSGLSATRKDDSSLLGGRGHLPGSLSAGGYRHHRQGTTCPARPCAQRCPLGNGLCWWAGGWVTPLRGLRVPSHNSLPSRVTIYFLQWLLDLAGHLCHPDAGTEHPLLRTLSWQMQAWLHA